MGTQEAAAGSLAPAVQEILAAARERDRSEGRVSVRARSLEAALASTDGTERAPIIGEVKPTSPTTEAERQVDPVAAARAMVDGGVSAISVLTEPDHFGGSLEALRAVREAVPVPVLRKDFVLAPAQLDAVAADAVLLIARFLPNLESMIDTATCRGMTPLVEVHDEAEVARAVEAGATVIGINNRDLASLSVDRSTFESVASAVPADVTLIAESGISTPAHRERMLEAGADGLLVGSAIMDGDIEANTRELVHR